MLHFYLLQKNWDTKQNTITGIQNIKVSDILCFSLTLYIQKQQAVRLQTRRLRYHPQVVIQVVFFVRFLVKSLTLQHFPPQTTNSTADHCLKSTESLSSYLPWHWSKSITSLGAQTQVNPTEVHPTQPVLGLWQRQSRQGEREGREGACETGIQENHTEQCQGLRAHWDADKAPGHFYRQTTYFRPHIAWEDW